MFVLLSVSLAQLLGLACFVAALGVVFVTRRSRSTSPALKSKKASYTVGDTNDKTAGERRTNLPDSSFTIWATSAADSTF